MPVKHEISLRDIYRRSFPYEVKCQRYDNDTLAWLNEHIGHRYEDWVYPSTYYFQFKRAKDAAFFKLVWA